MKKIKSIFAALVCVIVLIVSVVPAQAATTVDNLDDVANGVFKINMYIKGEEILGGFSGTCFLINDDTIVTAAHCVSISNEECYLLVKYLGWDQDKIEKNLKYSVTLTRDLTVKATLVNLSKEMDFAVLKLAQPINGHSALALRDSKTVKRAERVYSVGFPSDKAQGSTWDESTAAYKEGIVNKAQFQTTLEDVEGVTVFMKDDDGHRYKTHENYSGNFLELSADISSSGNSGGPIVDADGNVVALCSCGNDSTNFVSTIDQIMSACDTLGIKYTKAGSAATVEEPSSTEADTATQQSTTEQTTQADDNGSGKGLNKTTIIGVGAGVAVVIIAVVIVLVISSSKKKNAPAPINNAGGFTPPQSPAPIPSNNAESEGTTVLSSNMGDSDATTVLSASASAAYLIRTSNNERIDITKPYFKIGKDANRVDYCITGNPAVSRFHASIIAKNGQFFIVDNGTTNHTYVNESMIPANVETQITNGAKIRMADEKFEFKI